ncbi:MAG TPA: MFS transporter, partial [Planctomycetota bacterium]|nr:MFS transporter [Planctomycetota bacterium]
FDPKFPPHLADDASAKGKWMALLAAFLGWMFDGLEMGLFPLAGRPALREMLAPDFAPAQLEKAVGDWFGWIIAVFLVGAAAGGILFGWMGDRIGRVKAMVWSVATYSLFSGFCAFVTEPWHLMGLRFIASLGMGGEWALGVALVMEVWPSDKRPILAGLIGAAANVGFMMVGFMSLALGKVTVWYGNLLAVVLPRAWVDSLLANNGWRMLFLLGAVPALLTFVIRIFVPESEKWQQSSKAGDKPRVREIFAPRIRKTTILGACLAGLSLIGTWASVQWLPAWTSQRTGSATATAWVQIWLAIGACVFTIVAAIAAQKSNRRIAYFGLCLISLVLCQYIFRAKPGYGDGFLFFMFLTGGMTAAFYGWLPLYLPELFPTRVRATGSGFCFNIGRVLAAVGAITGGQLVKAFDGDYARMCAWTSLVYIVGLVVIWFCPETKDKPLPE